MALAVQRAAFFVSQTQVAPLLRIYIQLNWRWSVPRRFTCGLLYYALALNTGELHGSVYLNTFIMGAVEIPAYIACIFLMNWKLMGRRWSGVFGLTGAGIFSFICIPLIIFSQLHFF